MTRSTLLLTTTIALALCSGCDNADQKDAKKTAKAEGKKAADKTKDAKADAKTDAKTDVKADAKEDKPAEPAAGPNDPSNDKEFLGLNLPPMGDWKPAWDPDAKVAKWEHDDHMSGIIIRVVTDKLDSMDDLKAAAPMMMQVGTAISNVDEDVTKTDKGWWTVVSYDEGKLQAFLYVRKFGASTVVCSADLKSSMGEGIKKDDAMKACESFDLKAAG